MNWRDHRAQLRDVCRAVRQFLQAWDPAGMADVAPDDEYDRLVCTQ